MTLNRIFLRLKEQSCQNIFRNGGFATIWYMVGIVLFISLASFIVSEGYKNIQQHKVKTALNRAVKSASMQYDTDELAKEAKIIIPEDEAENVFKSYLTDNLKLNNDLKPEKDSIFENEFEIVNFQVIDDKDFPYTVKHDDVNFKHTFENPGVLAVVKTTVDDLWGTGETSYHVPAVSEVNFKISGESES